MNKSPKHENAYLRMLQETEHFIENLTDALVFELNVNPYYQTWSIPLDDLEASNDREVIRNWVSKQPETDIRVPLLELITLYKRSLQKLYGGFEVSEPDDLPNLLPPDFTPVEEG